MGKLALHTPLEKIRGVGSNFLKKLKKMDIETVSDLLWHFPTRYDDFSQIYKIADLIPGQEATIQGVVKNIDTRRSWRRNMTIVEAVISDETASIKAVWFNQPYIKNVLRPHLTASLSGKISLRDEELYMSNPIYEFASGQDTKHTARVIPTYPETKGLTSKGLRFLIKPILEHVEVKEFVPAEILKKENLPEIMSALKQIHFPKEIEDALDAKKRFAFEELFLLQLYNLKQRKNLAKQKARSVKTDIERLKKTLQSLPFELTESQKKSLWEIVNNISENRPMNRLLQGDVGSGKTIVAALAALEAAESGFQAIFMAPTEILARQHYKTLINFFPNFEKGIALLTSSEARAYYGKDLESKLKKPEITDKIAKNKIKIIAGTHALIQKNVKFSKPTFVVVDEQHRFGVRQRAALLSSNEKGSNSGFNPHFLSMSATPIPRTLSLTIFSNLDLSLITELPKDRRPIITKIIPPEKREDAYNFIRKQAKSGRQIFVICPRIAAPEKGGEPRPTKSWAGTQRERLQFDVKNVTEEYEKLSKKIFPDLRVAMLHGKLRPKEKEAIMNDFAEGQTDVLVSTSVVEVGVDIPNATLMMIEGSERFGLAQLYQFRGRVGRSKHQSYCFLFTDSTSATTNRRLRSIEKAKNGFELAEEDLKIRGPGQFFGSVQSGMPDLAMKAIQNPKLVKSAREHAVEIIKKDPGLKKFQELKNKLEKFQEQIHKE